MTPAESKEILQALKSGKVCLIEHYRYYTGEIVCTQFHFHRTAEKFMSKDVEIHGNGEDTSHETYLDMKEMIETLSSMEYERVKGSLHSKNPY